MMTGNVLIFPHPSSCKGKRGSILPEGALRENNTLYSSTLNWNYDVCNDTTPGNEDKT
jgi:hypothetical protein